MENEQQAYLAYMLRVWRTCTDEDTVWRASLESPHTGERQAFADLAALFAFLQERTQALEIHSQLGGKEVSERSYPVDIQTVPTTRERRLDHE